MFGILRQWPLSLHRKTAKLLNMAPILPFLPIFYQYSISRHFSFKNFCCKMETVVLFFNKKSAKYAKMSLKLPRQN